MMIKKTFGFTLLELSITILIIGILTVAGINFQASLSKNSHTNITLDKMNKINDAIKIFILENGRLPCPSDITVSVKNLSDIGQELTNCESSDGAYTTDDDYTYVYGGVPTKALGLPSNYTFDAWGNKIAYATNVKYTDKEYFIRDGEKGLTINNLNDDTITNDATYILISPGEDKKASYNKFGEHRNECSNDEKQQSNDSYYTCENSAFDKRIMANNTYIKDILNNNFDDIVIYENRNDLLIDLDLEDMPCSLNDLQDQGSNWNYASDSKCPNGICQQTTEIISKNACATGYISKNPSKSNNFRPIKKCLKYGKWSDTLYECLEGCNESNIDHVTGGNFSQDYELSKAINTKYLRAPLGERIMVQCVNSTPSTTNEYRGYVILECRNDGTWEYISGDCSAEDPL